MHVCFHPKKKDLRCSMPRLAQCRISRWPPTGSSLNFHEQLYVSITFAHFLVVCGWSLWTSIYATLAATSIGCSKKAKQQKVKMKRIKGEQTSIKRPPNHRERRAKIILDSQRAASSLCLHDTKKFSFIAWI